MSALRPGDCARLRPDDLGRHRSIMMFDSDRTFTRPGKESAQRLSSTDLVLVVQVKAVEAERPSPKTPVLVLVLTSRAGLGWCFASQLDRVSA